MLLDNLHKIQRGLRVFKKHFPEINDETTAVVEIFLAGNLRYWIS